MSPPLRRPTGPPKPRVPVLLMRVWDVPTRLFHWLVVVLLGTSWWSQHADRMSLHYWSGYTLLTLLLFRLAWGFIGSETSRFARFLRSPAAALAHLAAFPRREPDREVGHNAAGGWMVLVMLAALLLQTVTGLFAGDPVEGGGPLVAQVSDASRKWINRIHDWNFNVILALVALHVVAIVAYAVLKRHDLVRPMVTGKKRLPANTRQPAFGSPILAAVVALLAAALVWLVVNYA